MTQVAGGQTGINAKKPFKISKKTFSAMKRDLSDKKPQGRSSITKL